MAIVGSNQKVWGQDDKQLNRPQFRLYGHVAASSDHLYLVSNLETKTVIKSLSVYKAVVTALSGTFDVQAQNSAAHR